MSASELAGQRLQDNRRSTRTLRIALVSGEPLYREGMRLAFRRAQSLFLVDGSTIADAVQLAKSRRADVMLIDANNLAETMEKAKILINCAPELPLVTLMASATPDEVRSAFELGIRGCIYKREEGSEVIRILESIAQGSLYVPPELGAGLLRQGMV